MNRLLTAAIGCAWASGTAGGAWAQGTNLVMNGRVVSTQVKVVGGHAYAPLADIASALNMSVVPVSGGYEIRSAGGAHQVNGKLQGKIGDILSVGRWQFTVIGVSRANTYASHFTPNAKTFTPTGDTEELVIVTCRVKNIKQESQKLVVWVYVPQHTALTDDQGQSYSPVQADRRGDNAYLPEMLPGSQATFSLLFSVPKGTRLKDLVFTLANYPEQYDHNGVDARVSLAQ